MSNLVVHWQFEGNSVCVMPHSHPLLALERIEPRDLDEVPLVLLGRHSALRGDVDGAFRKARISPSVVAEVHSVSVACAMAEKGIGVAIVNQLLASCCDLDGLAMRPFVPAIKFSAAIAWLGSAPVSPTCEAFASYLAEALDRLPGRSV